MKEHIKECTHLIQKDVQIKLNINDVLIDLNVKLVDKKLRKTGNMISFFYVNDYPQLVIGPNCNIFIKIGPFYMCMSTIFSLIDKLFLLFLDFFRCKNKKYRNYSVHYALFELFLDCFC